jgi:hypothetical protein
MGNEGFCNCDPFNEEFEGSLQKICRQCGKPFKCNGNLYEKPCTIECRTPFGPCCTLGSVNDNCFKDTPYYKKLKRKTKL